MKRSPLLMVCAIALLTNACEQHPLPGQSPVSAKEQHGEGDPGGAGHSEAKISDGPHAAEAKPIAPISEVVESKKPVHGTFFPKEK